MTRQWRSDLTAIAQDQRGNIYHEMGIIIRIVNKRLNNKSPQWEHNNKHYNDCKDVDQ